MTARLSRDLVWSRLLTLACAATLALAGASACSEDETGGGSSNTSGGEDAGCLTCDADNNATDVGVDAEPDTADEPDVSVEEEPFEPVQPPPIILAVDTQLSTSTAEAGTPVLVTCIATDDTGQPLSADETPPHLIEFTPAESFGSSQEANTLIPTRVGNAQVTCTIPSQGMRDFLPADLEIVPGQPYSVTTEISPRTLTAGDRLQATCAAFDVFGNPIPDAETTLAVSPQGEGIEIDQTTKTLRATRSGQYTVTCQALGAQEEQGQALEVIPGPPEQLLIAKSPDQPRYRVGELIEFVTTATDGFGNPIPEAPITLTSDPVAIPFGSSRFRFDAEGLYTITATLPLDDTGEVEPLTAQTEALLSGLGPAIACDAPIDGGTITITEGEVITFEGTANDPNGVTLLTVNGTPAELDDQGRFSVAFPAEFGINFIDINATDTFGSSNSRTCAFLGAEMWMPENELVGNTVALRLNREAFDDDNRNDGLDSINDLLYSAVNSNELETTLGNTLSAANPLKPDGCDSRQCVFGVCVCLVSSQVRYQRLEINDTQTTRLSLIDGGLGATANLRNIRLRIRVNGRISGIPYDTEGWVTVSSADVGINLNVGLSNGQPSASVRDVSINLGNIDTNFSGLDGFVVNIVVDLFQGSIRNLIRDTLRGFIEDSFDDVLDGVLSGLDIRSLGTSFDVPRLLGGGNISVGFGVDFSSLNITPSRALFGIGTRLSSDTAHARPLPGVPYLDESILRDPNTSAPAAAAVHLGVLNGALVTLWRAGFLDFDVQGGDLGLPAEAQATVTPLLPPVVTSVGDGNAELRLGALRLELVWPGLFNEPITVYLGASANTRVRLDNNTLSFEDIAIGELFFSAEGISLEPNVRAILEDFLRELVQTIAGDALNNALPALPIPSFALPDSLSPYGLPGGTNLGLRDTTLTIDATHATLEGGFGTP